ncbi:hypothetical protein VPH35_101417 [Triticum aestivum]
MWLSTNFYSLTNVSLALKTRGINHMLLLSPMISVVVDQLQWCFVKCSNVRHPLKYCPFVSLIMLPSTFMLNQPVRFFFRYFYGLCAMIPRKKKVTFCSLFSFGTKATCCVMR